MALTVVRTSSPSLFHSSVPHRSVSNSTRPQSHFFFEFNLRSSFSAVPRFRFPVRALVVMEAKQSTGDSAATSLADPPMKLLFVEMGVGYDQHGLVPKFSFILDHFVLCWSLRLSHCDFSKQTRYNGGSNEGLQRCYLFQLNPGFPKR